MNRFWTPTQQKSAIRNIHESPLVGPSCCIEWRKEKNRHGTYIRFFHVHCRKHARNCEFCPIWVAKETLLKMQEMNED
jgi:hypothetical protein